MKRTFFTLHIVAVVLAVHVHAGFLGPECYNPENFTLENDVREEQLLGRWYSQAVFDQNANVGTRLQHFVVTFRRRKNSPDRIDTVAEFSGIRPVNDSCQTLIITFTGTEGDPVLESQLISPSTGSKVKALFLELDCESMIYYICRKFSKDGRCEQPFARFLSRYIRPRKAVKQSAYRILEEICIPRRLLKRENPSVTLKRCGPQRKRGYGYRHQ